VSQRDGAAGSNYGTMAACQLLGRGGVDIDGPQSEPRVTRDILRVDRTDAAGAEQAEADHGWAFRYGVKRTIRRQARIWE
jgi:hypothetical protein